MFFTPHADDIELGCPFVYLETLRLGYNVIEVVMTDNQYGTIEDDFKGTRLKKLREKELDNANAVFAKVTGNQVKVIRMGYIDGHLPLNKDSLNRTLDLIKKESPDLIFTCDPWYAQDFHADHLNTGRLIYYALFRLTKKELPTNVFYYYSYKSGFYIKCRWKDFAAIKEALFQHKSQYSPLAVQMIITLYNKLSLIRHLLERREISESFREQKIEHGKPVKPPKFKEMSFRKRLIYYLFSNVTIWGYTKFYNVSPEGLGLKMDYDNQDLLKQKDLRYSYKYLKNNRK